jgi:glycosyltransferase involved in cell wall biosynthesis
MNVLMNGQANSVDSRTLRSVGPESVETAARPCRTLIVCSHPVQYASPVFRLLAKDPRVEIQVAYCSMQGAEPYVDPDFGVEVKWDTPLLEGFPWVSMPNRSPFPGRGSFFQLLNPQLWHLIRSRKFDAVILYTGYLCASFWIAILAAKCSRIPVLFGTDAHDLSPRDGKKWKVGIKKLLWPRLFRLADVVIVPSSAAVALMSSLGIREDRIVLTPDIVNNDWWIERSARVNRAEVRARWRIPPYAVVIVFSAKLQPWKRPRDVLRAFACARMADAYLVFAGDGSLRPSLEAEAESLGITERVRFLGFLNQSTLPEVYTASDILVLPSDYEPFGLVVNEAMLCGCCVVVSDRVGARLDLVREGQTGYVFPTADIDALATALTRIAPDRANLKRIGQAARERISLWSPRMSIERTVEAIRTAVSFSSKSSAMKPARK